MRRWGWRRLLSSHIERALTHSMNRKTVLLALAASALVLLPTAHAQQALPTATQPLQLSVFGGFGGVYTGLSGGKNLDVLAGADLGLPPIHGIRPTIEL